MRIEIEEEVKIVGIGVVPWSRLGPDKWLKDYAIASLFDWDMEQSSDLPTVHSLVCELGHIPSLNKFNTVNLLASADFVSLLDKYYPGYALMTYKPISSELKLEGRKFIMTDPKFTSLFENKVSFRRLLKDQVIFPKYIEMERSEMIKTTECYESIKSRLGGDYVIQDEMLSGGKGTHVIRSYQDYLRGIDALGVMSKHSKVVISSMVNNSKERSIQCCITSSGLVVGPLQRQIVFDPLLANLDVVNGDKFCGASIFSEDQHSVVNDQASKYAVTIGNKMKSMGYRGIFGIDFLLGEQDELFVLEVNPRITGVTPLLTALADDKDIPFYLLHILELGGYKYTVSDSSTKLFGTGSLMILHSRDSSPVTIINTPKSGTYHLDGESISYISANIDINKLGKDQFIFQQYMSKDSRINPGGRIGVVLTNGNSIDAECDRLSADARKIITILYDKIILAATNIQK
jgi:hypothetical protein